MSESFTRQDQPAPNLKGGDDRFWSVASAALFWGAVLVGTAGIGFGVWSYLHERAFLAHAVHVEAHVTDVELGRDPKKYTTYTPTYEFADAQGNPWTNTGPADTREYYKVGSSVPVIYDPEHPAQSQIDSFWSTWGATVGSTLVGSLCLLLCLIPALSGRAEKRPPLRGLQ